MASAEVQTQVPIREKRPVRIVHPTFPSWFKEKQIQPQLKERTVFF